MDSKPSGVQSLDRAFQLLELLADAGGAMRLAELETATGLPLPTIHRLIRSLMHNGYVRQEPSRRYALGPRLIRLGETAGRTLGSWTGRQHLAELVDQIGETANMAVLEGDAVVYVAQVPSAHSMRMFTEVGRRVSAHCTGVGKALLSQLRDDQVRALLRRTGMAAQTARTHTDPEVLLGELGEIREQGWALDDAEQEIGVRCVAVPVKGAPMLAAISVSGPSGRITLSRVAEIAPLLQAVAVRLGEELRGELTR
ncbi:allantoin degradation transcriptional regulator AllR [Rugosimonospora acidiphila]|uniref:Allantoin degradation transcriptional regulator AllR n=1 Tax=Rugosimonospora acidiphila TaxID=556531 RepID=A0ABP9SNI0_9ACTN